jgi:transcriptional regulator with XRE-family HTH domain
MVTPGEKDPLTLALGRVIAARRREVGLTQERLAFLCKMHPTTISQVERGINSPTVRALATIARHLRTRAAILLDQAESTLERNSGAGS